MDILKWLKRLIVVVIAILAQTRQSNAQTHIVYNGGPIIANAIIYPVYYGSAWTTAAINSQQSYLTNLTNYVSGAGAPAGQSPYLRQYGVTSAFVAPAVTIASPVKNLTDGDIRTIIHSAQGARTLPAYASNILIMVFPATGFTPDGCAYSWKDSRCDQNGVSLSYHRSESTTSFYGVTFADTHSTIWPFNEISSHEIFESMTDPAWFSNAAAWNNTAATEICDDSACQPTNQTANVFTANGIPMLGCADNTHNGTCTTSGFIPNPAAPSCGAIRSGQGLIGNSPQNSVEACGASNILSMGSGVLGLLENNAFVWESPTVSPAITAVMQGDGNFLIIRGFLGDSAQDVVWSTNTFGNPGAYMKIQDDGNLLITTANNIPIWDYNYPIQPTTCGRINANQGLSQGTTLSSCDGRFKLNMQLDGNLVLAEGATALWTTNTPGWGNLVLCIMQPDGNFVVYNRANSPLTPLWAAGTNHGVSGNYLLLQNDGNLVINTAGGTRLWTSNTGGH
jgi:hypothetical protein